MHGGSRDRVETECRNSQERYTLIGFLLRTMCNYDLTKTTVFFPLVRLEMQKISPRPFFARRSICCYSLSRSKPTSHRVALERNGGGEEEGEGEEDLHGVGEGDRSGRSWRFLRCCRCRGGGSGTDTGRERAGFVFWDLACFAPPPPNPRPRGRINP